MLLAATHYLVWCLQCARFHSSQRMECAAVTDPSWWIAPWPFHATRRTPSKEPRLGLACPRENGALVRPDVNVSHGVCTKTSQVAWGCQHAGSVLWSTVYRKACTCRAMLQVVFVAEMVLCSTSQFYSASNVCSLQRFGMSNLTTDAQQEALVRVQIIVIVLDVFDSPIRSYWTLAFYPKWTAGELLSSLQTNTVHSVYVLSDSSLVFDRVSSAWEMWISWNTRQRLLEHNDLAGGCNDRLLVPPGFSSGRRCNSNVPAEPE